MDDHALQYSLTSQFQVTRSFNHNPIEDQSTGLSFLGGYEYSLPGNGVILIEGLMFLT